MRHRVSNKHLGLPTDQRLAVIRSLVAGVLEHGGVTTTEQRAKQAMPVLEKVITMAREDNLANRRLVRRWIPMGKVIETKRHYMNVTGLVPEIDSTKSGPFRLKGSERRPYGEILIKKLFEKIGPMFSDRNGGYTRITRLGGVSTKSSKGVLTIRAARRGDAASMVRLELVEQLED
jgi:large subunit ribosomal protein L17